ncbi:hypothetical protein Tco_0930421 [Tanacetum coccineum]
MTSTLPKSQGLEALGALFKKSKRPKSKKPPTETKVTPPKPTKSSEKSYSVSSGTVPNPQDLERGIQLASKGLTSTLDEGTRKSTPLSKSTATHPKDSGGNKQPLDMDLTSMTSDEGMTKTTPYLEGLLGDKDSGGNIPPADMEPIHTSITDPSGTATKCQTFADIQAYLLFDDEIDKESDEEEVLAVGDGMDEDIYAAEEVRTPSPKQDQPKPSNVQESTSDSSSPDLKRFDNTLPLTERQLIKYLRKVSRVLFNRIAKKQWEHHEEAVLLKDINNAVKDDPAANQKINEATETFTRIFSNITEVLSLVKGFDFSALMSTVRDLQAHALKQDEELAAWAKSSTNMAWTLAFKGQPFSAPSGSVTPTLALTHIPANVEGEYATNTATEELLLTPRGRLETQQCSQATPRIDKGKGIATESDDDPSKRLVPASTIIRPNPDEPVRVKFMINGKIVYLDEQEIQEYWDKKEKMKKVVKEAKLLAMSRPKVIKVVREEAKKLRIDPKEAIYTKAGETFKKA